MARFPIDFNSAAQANEIVLLREESLGFVALQGSNIVYDDAVETPITFSNLTSQRTRYSVSAVTQAGDGSITLPGDNGVYTCSVTQDVTSVAITSPNALNYLILSPQADGLTIALTGYHFEGGEPLALLSNNGGKDLLLFQTFPSLTLVLFKKGFV